MCYSIADPAMLPKPIAASAAAVLLTLVVRIGSRLVLKWRRGKRYDGLDSATRSVTQHLMSSSTMLSGWSSSDSSHVEVHAQHCEHRCLCLARICGSNCAVRGWRPS